MPGATLDWMRACAALVLTGCAGDVPFPDAPVCLSTATTAEYSRTSIDRVDLLFVIDSSPSMVEEQAALRRELPKLAEALVTPEPQGGWSPPTLPDRHVAVVSADLGTAGVAGALPGCSALGDDALFRHTASDPSCAPELPAYLSYLARPPFVVPEPTETPAAFAAELACIAFPGTGSCSHAQPLEAALKALWPSADPRITFGGADRLSHGDRQHAGFLRNDPVAGLSMLAVVIITDQDDCSVKDDALFDPDSAAQGPAQRCAQGQDHLFTVERYVNGLKALRPGNEQLVMLSVIAGVPEELTEAPTDYASNPAAQEMFFSRIAADPRMQVSALPDGGTAPSCETEHARATPPLRLVEAVQGFGANGVLTSICGGDWSQALAPLRAVIAHQLGAVCLPRPLPKALDGHVSCQLTWELPVTGDAQTITSCDQATFLVRDPERPFAEDGGQRCIVRQLGVSGPPEARVVEDGDGWFYDDFSLQSMQLCTTRPKQQIAYSPGIWPTTGVTARVECSATIFVVPAVSELRIGTARPELHDPCDPADFDACARALVDEQGGPGDDGFDRTLHCDPASRACVLPPSEGECPTGWTYDPAVSPWCEPGECQVPG